MLIGIVDKSKDNRTGIATFLSDEYGLDVLMCVSEPLLEALKGSYQFSSEIFNGVVFPIIRNEKEAEWIRGQNGLMIHVEHSKNINLDSRDYLITDNGSIDELYAKLRTVVSSHFKEAT